VEKTSVKAKGDEREASTESRSGDSLMVRESEKKKKRGVRNRNREEKRGFGKERERSDKG